MARACKWTTRQTAPVKPPMRDLITIAQVDAEGVQTGVYWVSWKGTWREVFPPWEAKKVRRRKGGAHGKHYRHGFASL